MIVLERPALASTSRHSVEHLAGFDMASSGTIERCNGQSSADSMFIGASSGVAGGSTGAVGGRVVVAAAIVVTGGEGCTGAAGGDVVDGDEVTAASLPCIRANLASAHSS